MASIWEKIGLDELIARGFPESTAKKIVSGELPMDYESRMARAVEQGHTAPVFHVGQNDLNVLDNETILFATPEPVIAAGYTGRNDRGLQSNTTYPLLLNPENYASFDAANLTWHGLDESPHNIKLPSGEELSLLDLTNRYEAKGYLPRDPKIDWGLDDEVLNTTNLVAEAASKEGAKGVRFDEVQDLGDNYDAMMEVAQYTGQWADEFDDAGKTVYAVTDPSTARSVNAAFDPDNIGKPYLMGAVGNKEPGLLDRATGLGATAADLATQTWDNMSLLDKAALATSPIPYVGAATGIAADVANMVNNPEERTWLNAALLASNFIPGNKIAQAGNAMVDAGKGSFRKIVDTFTKVPDADKDAVALAFDQVKSRIDQLKAKDESLKSAAQMRDERYTKPQNLSEAELKEYNDLMDRYYQASLAGRTGEPTDQIFKVLRGE